MIRLLITLLISAALTGCNEIAFELARAAVEEARKASEAEATNTNTQIAAQKSKQKKVIGHNLSNRLKITENLRKLMEICLNHNAENSAHIITKSAKFDETY